MNIMYDSLLKTNLRKKKKLWNQLKLKNTWTFQKTCQGVKIHKEVMKVVHREEEEEKVLHGVMNL